MRGLVTTTAFVVALSSTALAHHSAAPVFDLASEKTVAGIVKTIEWTNPHIWVWVDVQDVSGKVETYGFEGMSPNYLARRGWIRTSLQPGDKITVRFRPLKDGRPGGMFLNGKLESGTTLTSAGSAN